MIDSYDRRTAYIVRAQITERECEECGFLHLPYIANPSYSLTLPYPVLRQTTCLWRVSVTSSEVISAVIMVYVKSSILDRLKRTSSTNGTTNGGGSRACDSYMDYLVVSIKTYGVRAKVELLSFYHFY